MSELCSRTVRRRTLRESLSRTCGVRMSPARHVPKQPGFKLGVLHRLGDHAGASLSRRKFNTTSQLKQAIVLE